MTVTERTPWLLQTRAEANGVTPQDIEAELSRPASASAGWSRPQEVAAVVTFLASPRSVAINGDAVAVGGGSRARSTTERGGAPGSDVSPDVTVG